MKHVRKLSCCLLFAGLLASSCQEESPFSGWNSKVENPLITEARDFFEETITESAMQGTRTLHKEWAPGEVTPQWEKASVKRNEKYEFVFVPVYAQNQYLVREKVYRKEIDKMRSYHVPVSHVICIRKNKEGEHLAFYLTLIPTKKYYTSNKNRWAKEYVKDANFHGSFTGLVIYNDLTSFRLLEVNKVDAGEIISWFSCADFTTVKELKIAFDTMLGNRFFLRVVGTRADVNGGELEEVECVSCASCGKQLYDGETCPCQIEDWDEYEDPHGSGHGDGSGSDDGGSLSGGGSIGGSGSGNNSGGSSSNAPSQNKPKLPTTNFQNLSGVYVPAASEKLWLDKSSGRLERGCPYQGDKPICMGCAMAYLNYQLNSDRSIKAESFIEKYKEYEKAQGKNYTSSEGYDIDLIEGYVTQYYSTHTFTSFDNSISNGHAILTGVKLPNGESHAIVVVGTSMYQGHSTLIYMDSNYCELRQIRESDIEMYNFRIPVSKK